MITAASTGCLPHLPLVEAIRHLAELQFSSIAVTVSDEIDHLRPALIRESPEEARWLCRDHHRLNLVAFEFKMATEAPEYFETFEALCRLAKATKVVTLVASASRHGIPFNEEVERLRRLVRIARQQGVRVAIRTEAGRLADDPDTLTVLCDNVQGLGVALDPSHFIYQPSGGGSDPNRRANRYEKILRYVEYVLLRDTTPDRFQVRVGQGNVDYGRLINQLRRYDFNRILCVDVQPMEGVDQDGELRKLQLLLETHV